MTTQSTAGKRLAAVFIGDEVSAAGWRLAGVESWSPDPGQEESRLAQALATAQLVLLTSQMAGRLSPGVLESALRTTTPLVLLVPDVRGQSDPPNLTALIRGKLGLGT
ncbi:MAG: V-type ATP synthase subunit F [Magnetococcus sp. DMHC-6]